MTAYEQNQLRSLKQRGRRFARAGLCWVCGVKRVRGRKMCQAHLDYQREKQRALRDRRRAEGRCIRCETPHAEGHVLCARHLEFQNQASRALSARRRVSPEAAAERRRKRLERKKWRQAIARASWRRRMERRSEAGLCITCGDSPPRATGTGRSATARKLPARRCEACARALETKRKAKRQERAAAHECTRCGRPVLGARLCAECNARNRRRERAFRRKARRLGLCMRCMQPVAPGRRLCPPHLRDAVDVQLRYEARKREARRAA